jgi:DNA-binding NarL/FixJ family response regulator
MATDRALRVLVVDDHDVVRAGVCAIVSNNPRWEVCGEAENGRVAVAKVQELAPDVVILDISMPQMNGLEAAHKIRKIAPATKIIILTMHESSSVELAARQAGADEVITKRMAGESLTSALERLFGESASDRIEDSRTVDVQLLE